jgi:hypothetical protein
LRTVQHLPGELPHARGCAGENTRLARCGPERDFDVRLKADLRLAEPRPGDRRQTERGRGAARADQMQCLAAGHAALAVRGDAADASFTPSRRRIAIIGHHPVNAD